MEHTTRAVLAQRQVDTLKAVTVGRFGFPHTAQVTQVTRKVRDLDTRRWRTVTVYAVTSLTHAQASPAWLADLIRGHWAIENGLHDVRDVTFAEDASRVRTGTGPQVMACQQVTSSSARSAGQGRSTSPLRCATTAATHADHSPPSDETGHYERTPEPWVLGRRDARAFASTGDRHRTGGPRWA